MLPMPHGRRTMVWADESRAGFVREVARAASLDVVAAGSPDKGRSGAIASALGCQPFGDLRAALAESACELAWIVSPDDFGSHPGADALAIRSARQRGTRVASLEPIPASILDLSAWHAHTSRDVDPPNPCALASRARSFREAGDALELFGQARTLSIESLTRPEEGSLAAALFSACELVLTLMGEPESASAALVPAQPAPDRAPDTLRDLHGDLAVTLRFADARAATILASDRAGRWSRACLVLGRGGRLRVYDDGFEWIDASGRRADSTRYTARRGATPEVPHAVAATADSLDRLLDPSSPIQAPVDFAGVLALCEAAALSARTHQPESPSTIRRMALDR